MPERLVCRLYSLLKSKILAPRTCIFLQLVSDRLGVFMQRRREGRPERRLGGGGKPGVVT